MKQTTRTQIFTKTKMDQIRRFLRIYGNTIISYSYIEQYGLTQVQKELRRHHIDCSVSICYDTFKPATLFLPSNYGFKVAYALMPTVLVTATSSVHKTK